MNCWRCRDPGDARENIHQRPRPFQIQPKLSLSKTYNQLIMRQIVRCHIAWTFALLILLVLKWYIISLNLRQKKTQNCPRNETQISGDVGPLCRGNFLDCNVCSSKKIFRKQRRRHRAEWKSDPDVGEEEKTDNIKKHKDNTTLQIKSSCTPSKKNLNGRYAASR